MNKLSYFLLIVVFFITCKATSKKNLSNSTNNYIIKEIENDLFVYYNMYVIEKANNGVISNLIILKEDSFNTELLNFLHDKELVPLDLCQIIEFKTDDGLHLRSNRVQLGGYYENQKMKIDFSPNANIRSYTICN